MNEPELLELIERDRGAPLPEGPDPRWIAARVRVQLGSPTPPTEASETRLLLGLALLGACVPSAWALYLGQPAWLLLWPLLLLLLTPLLIRKGANS